MADSKKQSAGLLMFRRGAIGVELFLVHPGGPFFAKKDNGAWSIPKGLIEEDENRLSAARREFTEETGVETPEEGYISLGVITQKSGKVVQAWAFEGDCDPNAITSNTFDMEWPPRSGTKTTFPEVDRAAFYSAEEARLKLIPAQLEFVDKLEEILNS